MPSRPARSSVPPSCRPGPSAGETGGRGGGVCADEGVTLLRGLGVGGLQEAGGVAACSTQNRACGIRSLS